MWKKLLENYYYNCCNRKLKIKNLKSYIPIITLRYCLVKTCSIKNMIVLFRLWLDNPSHECYNRFTQRRYLKNDDK